MINLKKWAPYICAALLFVVLAYAYAPEVLKGKVVNQSDIASWNGMSHEITSYNKAHPNEDPTLWTNAMFSGMPAFTISVIYKGDFTKWFYDLLFFGERPPSYLIICLIGGFLLFLALGINPWLAIAGAIGITFCAYNFQIIQVGHNSKMVAIAFMPWVLAALIYAYRKNALLGAALFGLAMSFQIKANHPQITYYLGMIVLSFVAAELYTAIKEKHWRRFITGSALVLVAGLLGIAANINHLWPMQEYTKYSMRGGSELSGDKGLSLDYATQWSYGPGETFNLLIPNFKGGSSNGALSKDSETYQFLKSQNVPDANRIIQNMPLYWGPQSFTAGPMYMGAIIIFLFVLGLFLTKGPLKWWVCGLGVIVLLLSWGGHTMWFTKFFSHYVPLYNKFRTVSMILIVFQVLLPWLGIVAVQQFLERRYDQKHTLKSLYWAGGLTAGFCLLMALVPSLAGSFSSASDSVMGFPQPMLDALQDDRMSILRMDAFRSAAFILLAGGLLWLGYAKQWKPIVLAAGLGVLLLADMWTIDKRYLSERHFVRQTEFQQQFAQRQVDKFILQDPDLSYRVMDLTVDPFNDAHTSYWHKTIGGYSPAKLQRYQEMIDHYIRPELQALSGAIQTCKTWEEAQEKVGKGPVLNMLNMKYLVIQAEEDALTNAVAFGNAWTISDIAWVSSPDEEIKQVGNVDLHQTAVVHKEFEGALKGLELKPAADTGTQHAGVVNLIKYAPNTLEYSFFGNKSELVVFSEVYYPKGWKAWIDEQPAEIIRANYILRALLVPAGAHTIRFSFEPESFTKGAMYSRISSGLLLLLLVAGGGYTLVRRRKRIE